MPRLFTNNATSNDAVTVAAQGFTAFAYGTLAVVLKPTSFAAAYNYLLIGTDAQDYWEIFTGTGSFNARISLYNGSVSTQSGTSNLTAGAWSLMAWTKGTGTVLPRWHRLTWTTGSWTHGDFAGTIADNSQTGISEYSIGFNGSQGANSANGAVAAAAIWRDRALTDSEIERLGRGRWDEQNPDLLMEFPGGRDDLVRTTIDCSRNRARQSASGSQVTRDNAAGPPGFRYSALTRRR